MPKKIPPKTHLLLAIDASGSMYSLADDVRGGFNQYIKDLDPAVNWRVTLVLFSTYARVILKDARLSEVPELTGANYQPQGATALYDAIGNLIAAGGETVGKGERALVVVNTDGFENSSREWRSDAVRDLIKKRKGKGWEFVFLGADPEAWTQGEHLGMASTMTVKSGVGTRSAYSGISAGTRKWSMGADASAVTQAVDAETEKGKADGGE